MANRKKVYKPKPMTEGKRNLIQGLFQEYDIQSADDIQEALKDLLSEHSKICLKKKWMIISAMTVMKDLVSLTTAMAQNLRPSVVNMGNFKLMCHKIAKVHLNHRYFQKRQKDISSIDDKIIALYAKGMTTRQISEMIEDIYGFEVSEGMVSDITDKLLPRIEEWQNRPLSSVYPIVFIDAVHFFCA